MMKKICGYKTHVVLPSDLVGRRVRPDAALEVDVVALLDVAGVQGLAKGQGGARSVWEKK